MVTDKQILKWRFDVNTFRLIGRELITDRITAVYELVKNCYDANATRVDVRLLNVAQHKNGNSRIIISDNGVGMSFEDVKNKWMVVGTASKRRQLYSPPPFNRKYVGEKGIGRFAVDKLGSRVKISTKRRGDTEKLIINILWNEYEEKSRADQLTLFTDIENFYTYESADLEDSGTTLEISSVAELWTELDIVRLERELEKIKSPFFPIKPPFNIFITSNEYATYDEKQVSPDPIKYSSHHFSLSFNLNQGTQERLKFLKSEGEIVKEDIPIRDFGPIKFELFYFDENAKKQYNRVYKNDDARIDGIRIYRDGLITTPFAEFESQRDKKRDILGIDKRLWSGFLDKISTREVIGVIEITKQNNPNIVDATNRQDFDDRKEYRSLKNFVIEQLNVLGELKRHQREVGSTTTTVALEKAGSDIKHFASALTELAKKDPNLEATLRPLKDHAKQIDRSIRKGIQQQKRERREHIRKENIYLSLMSLQDYAIHISHAVRTSLGKVKRMAEFFRDRFPNAKYDSLFKEYASLIFEEMNRLNRVIDFMLSYAGSNIDFEDFSVKELLETLLLQSYQASFDSEGINPIVEISEDFVIHANKKFFEDIIQNLISNSVKSLDGKKLQIWEVPALAFT